MTEEEKKAIEWLDIIEEGCTYYDLNFAITPNGYQDLKKSMCTIRNLIEKLQKERDIYYYEWKTLEADLINKDYIPKDKIREYIKEKEEEKEGVKNISLEEYAITSKELKESEICLLKCILEEK